MEDSTKEKVMNAPAKRYDLSSPTAVHLDPDSLQEVSSSFLSFHP